MSSRSKKRATGIMQKVSSTPEEISAFTSQFSKSARISGLSTCRRLRCSAQAVSEQARVANTA